jgi:hypothetical protein
MGPVRLRGGKGCVNVSASDPTYEWDVQLTRAERWGPNERFLLAGLNADHHGSGAWDFVFLYDCEQGEYPRVFSERYLYGAKVELGTGNGHHRGR